MSSFRLYRLFSQLGWPRSYAMKFYVLAFVCTHVPLIGVIIWLVIERGSASALSIFLVTLLATLIGTAIVLWGMRELLHPIMTAAGALRHYLDHGEVLSDLPVGNDQAGRMIADVSRALRQLARTQQELRMQASRDALTGVLNRRAAEIALARHLQFEHLQRSPFWLVLVDVDHFKSINDCHGHPVGDRVLQAVAEHLRSVTRETDWVARPGGDEFMVGLCVRKEEISDILERLRQFNVPANLAEEADEMTLSIGAAVAGIGDDAQSLLVRADEALYQSKQAGRDRWTIHGQKQADRA